MEGLGTRGLATRGGHSKELNRSGCVISEVRLFYFARICDFMQ